LFLNITYTRKLKGKLEFSYLQEIKRNNRLLSFYYIGVNARNASETVQVTTLCQFEKVTCCNAHTLIKIVSILLI